MSNQSSSNLEASTKEDEIVESLLRDLSDSPCDSVAALKPQYTTEGNLILSYYDHARTEESEIPRFLSSSHREAYEALYGDENHLESQCADIIDLSSDNDQDDEVEPNSRRFKNASSNQFPIKLYGMLTILGDLGLDHIVAWKSHGRAFQVYDTDLFLEKILPRFFKQTKITSFQRQLNLYGFRRILHGRDTGSYYHELFLRGKPFLCKGMFRTKIKGKPSRKKASDLLNCEPDFYSNKFLELPRTDSQGAQERLLSFFGSDQNMHSFLNSIKLSGPTPFRTSNHIDYASPHSNISLSSAGTDHSKKRSNTDLSGFSLGRQHASFDHHGSRKKLSIGSSMQKINLNSIPSDLRNAVFDVTQPIQPHGYFNQTLLMNSQAMKEQNNQAIGGTTMMLQHNGSIMNFGFNSHQSTNPLLMGIGNTSNLFMDSQAYQNTAQPQSIVNDNTLPRSAHLKNDTSALDLNPTPLHDLQQNYRLGEGVLDSGDDGELKDLLGTLLNDSSH